MSRRLLLLRHGKSDWTASYGHDAERPLNARGRRASRLIGRFLTATGNQPQLAVTSPARRATETLKLASRAGQWSCPTSAAPCFYDSGPAELVHHLREDLPDSADRVLVVGHEPTWSQAVEMLTGAHVRMPTAAVACIELDTAGWSEVTANSGRLLWLVPPRLLEAAKVPKSS